MLIASVGPDAEVVVVLPDCEGILTEEGFEELLDSALQYEDVLNRVFAHPRVKAHQLAA